MRRGFLFSMYLEALTPSVRYAGRGHAELSAAGGGEREAEHWAVPQSNASGESPRSSATRHNRVESLQDLFPLRGRFMLRLMACIHLAGTLGHGLSEKSQFSSFSTRRGVRCVKNARNPQRIPVLFALRPLTPCEKVVHFFVFRNALKTACGQFFLNVFDSKCTKDILKGSNSLLESVKQKR